MLRRTLFLLSLAAVPLAARADIVSAINSARIQGCHGTPGVTYKLRPNARLDAAARLLSLGVPLPQASSKAGYRAQSSASVQIANVTDDRDIERIVQQRFCAQVSERTLRDIGTYRRGPDIWLLVAAPFSPPTPGDNRKISRRVLELTNAARAHARNCGSHAFAAAPPLVLAPTLNGAALEHSRDMAEHDVLDHIGHDGSTPAVRVTRTGYKWRTIGENLASGILTPDEVVNGWVGSPHHCENLMDPRFTQMAVAYVVNASSAGGIYWTQVFATPR